MLLISKNEIETTFECCFNRTALSTLNLLRVYRGDCVADGKVMITPRPHLATN